MTLEEYIRGIPKPELHIHVEGSLEPELMVAMAARNGVRLPYGSVEAVRAAYRFTDLQSFLDIYYAGAAVLVREEDFYEMTRAYLARAHGDRVTHVELFFDPQTHTERGVAFGTVYAGIRRALDDARREWGMTSYLILCFLRHLTEASAFATLEASRPWREGITAVGLDSSERGNPPEKFAQVFAAARAEGLRAVAHAGEEGPPEYIWSALDVLKAERIDHGVRCLEDPKLVARLREEQVPLTVCPLSNVKLRVFPDMRRHNLKQLLAAGLCASVHSDDPAYFGGYINANLLESARGLGLTAGEVYQLVRNAWQATFLPGASKQASLDDLAAHWDPGRVAANSSAT